MQEFLSFKIQLAETMLGEKCLCGFSNFFGFLEKYSITVGSMVSFDPLN